MQDKLRLALLCTVPIQMESCYLSCWYFETFIAVASRLHLSLVFPATNVSLSHWLWLRKDTTFTLRTEITYWCHDWHKVTMVTTSMGYFTVLWFWPLTSHKQIKLLCQRRRHSEGYFLWNYVADCTTLTVSIWASSWPAGPLPELSPTSLMYHSHTLRYSVSPPVLYELPPKHVWYHQHTELHPTSGIADNPSCQHPCLMICGCRAIQRLRNG